MKATPVEALRLFNEKVERLRRGRLVKALKRSGYGVSVKCTANGRISSKRHGPDEDAVDAAILSMRFFIQDNEPCSLRRLALIYKDRRIPEDIRNSFHEARSMLNEFLDSKSSARIQLSSERITSRQVLYAVIYGDRSHTNEAHRERYDRLFDGAILSSVAHNNFMLSVVVLLKIVFHVGRLNDTVLKRRYLE